MSTESSEGVPDPVFTPEQEAWLESFLQRRELNSGDSGSGGPSAAASSSDSAVSTGGIGELVLASI